MPHRVGSRLVGRGEKAGPRIAREVDCRSAGSCAQSKLGCLLDRNCLKATTARTSGSNDRLRAGGPIDRRTPCALPRSLILFPMHGSPLERVLAGYESLLIGFSGGVDSSLLAVTARLVLGRARTVAAIGTSPSVPATQLEQARRIAGQFDLNLIEVGTNELDDPDYVANSTKRCYYCKRELWSKLVEAAGARGMAAVAEGTNADDLDEHRPGLAAAAEFGIGKPLGDAG